MRVLRLIVPLVLLLAAASARADSSVLVQSISFRVSVPGELLITRTVKGKLYLPASDPNCARSVVLLLHGLSYGAWAWDFPLQPQTYSMARSLAAAGFPAVAIDELGYGTSDHPSGYELSVENYGEVTSQIVSKLRGGAYSASTPLKFAKVILFGHSAGTEMAELAAGLHGNVDGLIAGAYSHTPSAGILLSVITQDTPNALLHPYIYFAGTPSARAADMFDLSQADPAIVDRDTQLANLTPSGEILTIGNQPSRASLALITAPVLLVMAQNDALFPPNLAGVDLASTELALFLGSSDRQQYIVPLAGHTFMLHPNAPDTQQVVKSWLAARFARCSVP